MTDTAILNPNLPAFAPAFKHMWFITGPAGCGKTSVAKYLHKTIGFAYLEGDAFHGEGNIQKMSNGHPLTDADRWDWLVLLREESLRALNGSANSSCGCGVVVTCSALKRKYRDVIRIASCRDPCIKIRFIFLDASESLLIGRVCARKDHYMKEYMVRSQLESLETPQIDETDVLSVKASGTRVEVQQLALAAVKQVLDRG